jgi:hypothetical protein
VNTIGYKANRMVLFLNAQDSLHAVTPREPSPFTRKLVNIIGEVDKSFPKRATSPAQEERQELLLGQSNFTAEETGRGTKKSLILISTYRFNASS